jgi:Protein of unknown function (DUF3788)
MSEAVVLDSSAPPSEADVEQLLGPATRAWHTVREGLAAMGATAAWNWGGARSGWELRGTRAGRPFTTLMPRPGAFQALVIIGPNLAAEAAALPLGRAARAAFEAAHPYPDGRWLFLPVVSRDDAEDVLVLLELKLPPRVRARYEQTYAARPVSRP